MTWKKSQNLKINQLKLFNVKKEKTIKLYKTLNNNMLDMLSNIMMVEVQEGEERKNEMEKYI